MAKTTPVDRLSATVSKILQKYADDVETSLSSVTKKVGQAGATALRQESAAKFGGTGRYAQGWKSQFSEDRLSASATIYNEQPGLPHLLEHGHAKRGGGRTEGRVHIATVEEQLIKQFVEEAGKKL